MGGNTKGHEREGFLIAMRLKDPGDAGVLRPVNDGELCLITTGANGETRTLEAATSYPYGFKFTCLFETDGGGDCVVTAVANANGDAQITLEDLGNWITVMVGLSAADTKTWRVYLSDGGTLA